MAITARNFVLVGSTSSDDIAKLDKALEYLQRSYDGDAYWRMQPILGMRVDINHSNNMLYGHPPIFRAC